MLQLNSIFTMTTMKMPKRLFASKSSSKSIDHKLAAISKKSKKIDPVFFANKIKTSLKKK